MNNFLKYLSASNIDVAEMFTKDNLVSITGFKAGDGEVIELAVLNKDNNFSNMNQPTENPDYFEVKFDNIGIGADNNYPGSTIIINRSIVIVKERIDESIDESGNNYYDFTMSPIPTDGEDIDFEELGQYYYTE